MCMVDYADEMYRIWRKREVRARQSYKCIECGRDIEKGETYQLASGLHSEGWDTWHTCLHCAWAAEWLLSECNGYLHAGVRENLEEHWTEDPLLANLDLGRRIVGMRRRWRNWSGGLLDLDKLRAA